MIKLIALHKRKAHITMEEFKGPWVQEHTPQARQLAGLQGYRVYRAMHTQQQSDVAPYDGTAERWFNSIKIMEQGFASADGQATGADADDFCTGRLHLSPEEFIIMLGPEAAG